MIKAKIDTPEKVARHMDKNLEYIVHERHRRKYLRSAQIILFRPFNEICFEQFSDADV